GCVLNRDGELIKVGRLIDKVVPAQLECSSYIPQLRVSPDHDDGARASLFFLSCSRMSMPLASSRRTSSLEIGRLVVRYTEHSRAVASFQDPISPLFAFLPERSNRPVSRRRR